MLVTVERASEEAFQGLEDSSRKNGAVKSSGREIGLVSSVKLETRRTLRTSAERAEDDFATENSKVRNL